MPKVFRYTYEYQQKSAYVLSLKYGEAIPQVFKCYVNCKSASVTVRNYENGYFEEEKYDVDVSNENAVFSGRQSFDYYANIKCSEEKFSGTWDILCSYDSGTLSCEIY